MAVAASSPLYSLLLMLSFRQDISNGLKQRTFLMGYYTASRNRRYLNRLTVGRVTLFSIASFVRIRGRCVLRLDEPLQHQALRLQESQSKYRRRRRSDVYHSSYRGPSTYPGALAINHQ